MLALKVFNVIKAHIIVTCLLFLVTGEPGSVQVVTGDTVAHPTYVQYVDETPEAATIYTTTNGQM
jgi:hypothetical protein